MAVETSKPRRIKALLSSFLKGVSHEEKGQGESKIVRTDTTDDAIADVAQTENEGYVIVDEWPPKNSEHSSTVQPLNRQAFFKRVETFSTSTWFAKPEEASPLQCAQFGWENIDVNSLKCVSCKEVQYGGLPPKWEIEAYRNACKKLQESLKTGHSKICPWPSNPSPASFQEVELLNHSQAVDAFRHRVSSIRCFGLSVPAVNRPSLTLVNAEESVPADSVSGLVKGVLGEEPTSDYKERIELVCILALCGWSRSSPEQSKCPTMTCEYCRRNVGLWNFTTCTDRGSTAQAVDDESPEPAAKRLKVEKGEFDPIGEHRSWCPWTKPTTSVFRIHSSSQQKADAKESTYRPAWRELLVLLQRMSSPEKNQSDGMLTNKDTTPPSQAWKVVRRITNFWQSRGAARKT